MTERRAWIGIAIIVALSCGRVLATHRVFSQTSDENIHVAAGYDILVKHSWMTDIHHPPLSRVFFALPFIHTPEPAATEKNARGNALFFRNDRYTQNLALARLGNLLFLAIGILAVARWAMRILSPTAALLSGALFAMLPVILGHAGLATTDMAVTAILPLALDEFSRLIEAPSWRRGVAFGIALAAGVLSKYSFLPYFPVAAFLLLIVVWLRSREVARLRGGPYPRATQQLRNLFLWLGAAAILATLLVWLGFGCSFDPLIAGIDDVRKHNSGGHRNFLFGKLSWIGWWYYFPVALFFKTPIPFLILALVGCALLIRKRPEIPLTAAAILGIAMTSQINIGVRHVMPIYAPLSIAAAAAIVNFWRYRIASAVLVAWMFIDGVVAHPDYLPWFNEFAREPAAILNDSNFDWGQDVLRLVRYTRREHVPSISVLLFTATDLDRIGLPPHTDIKTVQDIHGWFAISEMEIAIGNTHSERVRMWLDRLIGGKPYKRIGKTIRLYKL